MKDKSFLLNGRTKKEQVFVSVVDDSNYSTLKYEFRGTTIECYKLEYKSWHEIYRDRTRATQ